MSRLIDDLLDAVTIDSGKLALELRPVPVAQVLTEVRERGESLARERGAALHATCDAPPEARDPAIVADRARVVQALGNLVGNALTFCRSGDAMTIACQTTSDAVEFTISDTGPGVDPGLVPHLFEPYWSAPPAIRRRIGLGLYIAKGIVERHGGQIRVERRDAGTAFSVSLPRAPKP
jgi:signal transduction histidine kinase